MLSEIVDLVRPLGVLQLKESASLLLLLQLPQHVFLNHQLLRQLIYVVHCFLKYAHFAVGSILAGRNYRPQIVEAAVKDLPSLLLR